MKKSKLLVVSLLALTLCGCNENEQIDRAEWVVEGKYKAISENDWHRPNYMLFDYDVICVSNDAIGLTYVKIETDVLEKIEEAHELVICVKTDWQIIWELENHMFVSNNGWEVSKGYYI